MLLMMSSGPGNIFSGHTTFYGLIAFKRLKMEKSSG